MNRISIDKTIHCKHLLQESAMQCNAGIYQLELQSCKTHYQSFSTAAHPFNKTLCVLEWNVAWNGL